MPHLQCASTQSFLFFLNVNKTQCNGTIFVFLPFCFSKCIDFCSVSFHFSVDLKIYSHATLANTHTYHGNIEMKIKLRKSKCLHFSMDFCLNNEKSVLIVPSISWTKKFPMNFYCWKWPKENIVDISLHWLKKNCIDFTIHMHIEEWRAKQTEALAWLCDIFLNLNLEYKNILACIVGGSSYLHLYKFSALCYGHCTLKVTLIHAHN